MWWRNSREREKAKYRGGLRWVLVGIVTFGLLSYKLIILSIIFFIVKVSRKIWTKVCIWTIKRLSTTNIDPSGRFSQIFFLTFFPFLFFWLLLGIRKDFILRGLWFLYLLLPTGECLTLLLRLLALFLSSLILSNWIFIILSCEPFIILTLLT